MSEELHPTPTRLGLLIDVAAGRVYRVARPTETFDRNGASGRRVTADMRDLERAGWVHLSQRRIADSFRVWDLTDTGRKTLANAGGAR